MNDSPNATPRRDFLGQMAASALVLAGSACAAPAAAAQAMSGAPAPGQNRATAWDDSWFGRLTAKHKAVFDSPEFDEGNILGPGHATRYINGVRDALGVPITDVQTVVVIRHKAIPFAFNDAMWEKYAIGEDLKIKGEDDKWATRNPFAGPRGGGARQGATDRPQANAVWLSSHGHIFLGCALATQGYAGKIAERTKGSSNEIFEELKANLVPGMILQPNGVYAVLRAQEAGCAFMRST